MAESIKLPNMPTGRPEQQIVQMYSYMYRMAQTMNVNLKEIGNGALTDEEAALMNRITAELQEPGIQAQPAYNYAEAETLKSLIIKTAQFVKNEVDNYRLVLFGDESAEGSQGNWKRKKGLRVDVTPDGVQQTYSYAEIVQGLKTFEINAKNYIKTGYLRTENAVPIYGVAIGRDVVSFSEDGTETYNDSNKVAELTADALTFYQGGNPVAKYTGNRLSFYSGGTEVMYITNGKIYVVGDLEITAGGKLKIASSGYLDIDTPNFKINSTNQKIEIGEFSSGKWTIDNTGLACQQDDPLNPANIHFSRIQRLGDADGFDFYFGDSATADTYSYEMGTGAFVGTNNIATVPPTRQDLGTSSDPWGHIYGETIHYDTLSQNSTEKVKHEIESMQEMGEKLDMLRPVTFIYNNDPGERTRYGLIYEETLNVLPEICGDEAINYMELVPMLLKEIQDLRKRVKALEDKEDR